MKLTKLTKRMKMIFAAVLLSAILAGTAFATLPGGVRASGEVQIVVEGPAGEIASGWSDSLKASDALDQVLRDNGKDPAVLDAGMIRSIDGVANADDWSSYWYTVINRDNGYTDVNEGITDLVLKAGDRLIVYYSAYDTYTANKIGYSTSSANKKLTITLENEQLDWFSGSMAVHPLNSSTLKAWVDGNPVSLQGNQIVLDQGLAAGTHTLKLSDYQSEPGLVPKVVADTLAFTLREPTCTVRVEGLTDTLGTGTATGANALEIATRYLDSAPLSYTLNPNYGGYLTEIGGLAEKDLSPSTGWMFYVKNPSEILSPEVGMGSYIPEDGDELILYFTDFSVPFVNGISFDPGIVQGGSAFRMRFTYAYTDWSDWMNPVQAVRGISGALVTLDDTNFVTDGEGWIDVPAGLPLGSHAYKISGYNGGKLNTVVMDQGSFTIDGIHSPDFNFASSSYQENVGPDNRLVRKDIPAVIRETSSLVATYPDPWASVSMARLGGRADESYLAAAWKEIARYGAPSFSNAELEKLIFGLTAAGYDSTDFAGADLPAELYGRNIDSFLVSEVVYGLLAMDYASIPDSHRITRSVLLDKLLSLQVGTGQNRGWSLGAAMDPDLTGAALCALAPFRDRPGAASAIDGAVASLAARVDDSGYLAGHYGVSSETNAFVIVGLLAVGVNPEGLSVLNDGTPVSFAKAKGDLVSALLSFRLEGGGFRHVLEGSANTMSTEQSLRALIALEGYKAAGTAFNYYAAPEGAVSRTAYVPDAAALEGPTEAVAAVPSVRSSVEDASGTTPAALDSVASVASAPAPVLTGGSGGNTRTWYLVLGSLLTGGAVLGGAGYAAVQVRKNAGRQG